VLILCSHVFQIDVVCVVCVVCAEMEDDHTIKTNMDKHGKKAFFGVYDGHNGDICAHWSAANLWQYIDRLEEHTDAAIQNACLEADKAFLTSDPDSYVACFGSWREWRDS